MVFMATNLFPSGQGQTTTSDLSRPPPADCPRCGSTNTKFCYYNNYNKSQPRYFCKSCKRHWTKGGALRSIPAGRRRRNKRHRPSISAAAAAAVLPRREQSLPDPFSLSADVQNDMSDILYRALVGSSAVECINTGVPQCTILESHGTAYAPRNQSTEFTFSTTFNYQFSSENLDSTEESTVTTSTAPPQASAVNPAAELWNWNNEFDFLGSTADTYTLWDDFGY